MGGSGALRWVSQYSRECLVDVMLRRSGFRCGCGCGCFLPVISVDFTHPKGLYNWHEVTLYLGSSFFWDVMQHTFVLRYRRFGTMYRFRLQGTSSSFWTTWHLKMQQIHRPETSVTSATAKISTTQRRKPAVLVFSLFVVFCRLTWRRFPAFCILIQKRKWETFWNPTAPSI